MTMAEVPWTGKTKERGYFWKGRQIQAALAGPRAWYGGRSSKLETFETDDKRQRITHIESSEESRRGFPL